MNSNHMVECIQYIKLTFVKIKPKMMDDKRYIQ